MRRFFVISVLIFGMILVASTALAKAEMYQGFRVVNVLVNGRMLQSDIPAINLNGRTVLPLRALAEAAGMDVQWDPVMNIARLTSVLTPEKFLSLQLENEKLTTELAAAKQETDLAKAELTIAKRDLATAQAEVKKLKTITPVQANPSHAPVVVSTPNIPPLKTVKEIQDYLQANLASVTTPAGILQLTFNVNGPNDNDTVPYDYWVWVDWNPTSYFTWELYSIEHSLTAPPGSRADSIRILRAHSEKIYEVMAESLPGKKIGGAFFRTWYEYPAIRVNLQSESHLRWRNYSGDELGTNAYRDATLSTFHFTSNDK